MLYCVYISFKIRSLNVQYFHTELKHCIEILEIIPHPTNFYVTLKIQVEIDMRIVDFALGFVKKVALIELRRNSISYLKIKIQLLE